MSSNSVNKKLEVFTYLVAHGVKKNNAAKVSNKTGNKAKAEFYRVATASGLNHDQALRVITNTNTNEMKSFATSFKSFSPNNQTKVVSQYFKHRKNGNTHNRAINRVFGSFFG
jgi:hypothetical protein